MANLGSFTRSAARGTFSAYRSLPIRWRLAGGSAALTFVILASFAVIVGILTNRQVRSQFDNQLITASQRLTSQVLSKQLVIHNQRANCDALPLTTFAEGEHAVIRVFDYYGGSLLCTQASEPPRSRSANVLFSTAPLRNERFNSAGYRVIARIGIPVHPSGYKISILYAQPLSDIDQTLARVQAFLLLGVLGGAVLALLAGLFVSERAMSPIKELTSAAREIGRTEDTRRRIPHPEAEDEIAELARTLEGMLGALDASRTRTQSLLERQREFVADASHELRTPLTSVLANLELLTEELEGEQSETAEAALRSTRRMRRLVGDLLLLARADARRSQPHRATDLGEILIEAAAELGPMADGHQLLVHAEPAPVLGARDELHRLILNLLENAVRHTPPGTRVRARTSTVGEEVELVVEDRGPGIPPDLSDRVFERFVRGGRDGGRGSGLGLAIVRSVVDAHGGNVRLEPTEPRAELKGTRFVIRLPQKRREAAHSLDADVFENGAVPGARPGGAGEGQTSTTTGRTIGRRRNRS
ncbi:MAG TPA: HAMP domain-containing sensor histidine kinase [Solirubrobacteraceae bacterium]|nr:HAMP domain-containing sensor histidine kinase [Solirubrobacteraceae bacterium]